MAPNGGLAEPMDNAPGNEPREAQQEPGSVLQDTNTRHIRIVHSTDRPGGGHAPPTQDRPVRVGAAVGAPGALLDRSVQGQIGLMLRDVFSDVAKEPVPNRFVELLEALAAQEEQQ